MKVTTINPVYINKTPIGPKSRFLSFDGSNRSDVTAFQSWFNSKGFTPKLDVDGMYGPKTKAAHSAHGAEYDKSTETVTPGQPLPSNLSTTDSKGNKKDGYLFDKAKGVWSKAKDAGIIDSAKNWLNNKLGGAPTDTTSTTQSTPDTTTPTPEKKGMSKRMKIGLIVGGVALVAFIIYKVRSKK